MRPVYLVCLVAVVLSVTACKSQSDHINGLIQQLAAPDLSIETQAYYELVGIEWE